MKTLRYHAALRVRAPGRGGAEGLFFSDADKPFDDGAAHDRARKAWRELEAKLRETEPKATVAHYGFHECRHTCASIFIAAGVNAKALSTYLGHSSIQITLDRYGHLMPGNETEAVALVDAYLERATTARQSPPLASVL